jgi:DNA gyrase subunit B
LYKIKKGKQEVYVKDDAELNAHLLNAALDGALLHVSAAAPPLSAAALEALAKEHMLVESIVTRLSNRYDINVLRALSSLPGINDALTDNLDAFAEWTEKLSAALPKTSGDRNDSGNGGTFAAELERGDADGEGVRIAVRRMQHGVSTTRYVPKEFFDTNEYRHIREHAEKLRGLLADDALVERGEKKLSVRTFNEAIQWLMSEARKGQSIQRYKGLGEMNPDQLWDTTVNPETRRLLQVKIDDAVKADEVFTTLMGDQVEPRREFIERNALTVSNLDV